MTLRNESVVGSKRTARGAKPFAPWRQEFRHAAVLALMSAVALWQGISSGKAPTTVVGLLLSVCLAVGARYAWASGKRRWYGKAVEDWAVTEVVSHLGRWSSISCEVGVYAPGAGDGDLVVTGRRGMRCLVEVKSFNLWRQTLWSVGARERNALEQATTAARALGCQQVVVWLPRGRPTFLQRMGLAKGQGRVKVVFGNPAGFAHKIKRMANRKMAEKGP